MVFVKSNPNVTASLSPECLAYSSYLAYNWTCQSVLRVGTEERTVVTPDKHVTVQYVGDLAPSQVLRDFSTKYLLVPEARLLPAALRTSHPQVIVGVCLKLLIMSRLCRMDRRTGCLWTAALLTSVV